MDNEVNTQIGRNQWIISPPKKNGISQWEFLVPVTEQKIPALGVKHLVSIISVLRGLKWGSLGAFTHIKLHFLIRSDTEPIWFLKTTSLHKRKSKEIHRGTLVFA